MCNFLSSLNTGAGKRSNIENWLITGENSGQFRNDEVGCVIVNDLRYLILLTLLAIVKNAFYVQLNTSQKMYNAGFKNTYLNV